VQPDSLDRVATTAGSLTSPAGVVAGFSRAFVAAAILAVLLAVVAFVRMPSTRRYRRRKPADALTRAEPVDEDRLGL
jgi:predicted MFS family arabinose efflux permease